MHFKFSNKSCFSHEKQKNKQKEPPPLPFNAFMFDGWSWSSFKKTILIDRDRLKVLHATLSKLFLFLNLIVPSLTEVERVLQTADIPITATCKYCSCHLIPGWQVDKTAG